MSTSLLFVLVVLTSYRLTRLFTLDSLFEKQRYAWFKRFPPTEAYSRLYARDVSKWGQLLNCSWCLGFWVSGLVVVVSAFVGSVPLPVLWWWAVAAAVGLIANNLDGN